MASGTPLGSADNDERYGAQGAFLIEAGISSSYHIANFFGLTEWIRQPEVVPAEAAKETARETAKQAAKQTAKQAVKPTPEVSSTPVKVPDLTAVLWPLTTLSRPPESSRR